METVRRSIPSGTAPTPSRRGRSGFTFIELLLTVTLMGVLGSIAYPAYASYVNRGRCTRAIADVRSFQLVIERFYTSRGTYPQTLADVGMADRVDPWGHPYVFVRISDVNRGQVRKDKNLNPINSDYDLYSLGADGDTATQLSSKQGSDDIVRARDGAYIGLASEF